MLSITIYIMLYKPAGFGVIRSSRLGGDAITRKHNIRTLAFTIKLTQNVHLYPLHYVTYSHAEFKVAIPKFVVLVTHMNGVCNNIFYFPPTGSMGRGIKVKYN